MSRRPPLTDAQTWRTACARGVLRAGVEEKSGEVLTVGEDLAGRKLPSKAWMALRRLGWRIAPPAGVKVNDRVVRMAQEQAGRALRAGRWRADLVAGVLAAWPVDPAGRTPQEWQAVREAVPGGQFLPSSIITSRTRQSTAFERRHGRLPVDVFELESVPRTAPMLLLAACDGQQASIERADEPRRALLRLQLPTRADPRSSADWRWVSCPITLPPTIPPDAVLHLPTLGVTGSQVRADLAYTHAVPKTTRSGHSVGLGVDWGLNTLLSAGATRLHRDGTITALGGGGMFRAAGVLAKQHRLRRLSEYLHAKAEHYQRLIAAEVRHDLTDKHQVLREEIRAVSARRSNLNDALARSAARWTVDQAITAHATVIYVEDLRSLEARGMGRTINTRLSGQVRGQIVDRIRHLAAEVGIAVVTVPARNTSRHCPCCLVPLRHRKAPDRPTAPGWKWAICPGCGYQGDRDMGAWKRIAARGLTHQAKTVTDRTSGTLVICSVVDTFEAGAVIAPTIRRDRSKTGPTRPRPTRPAPRRRRAPSPTRPHGPAGKRPEGHAPTDRTRLPRAAHRHQGVTTISTPPAGHRPRGAALGAGFHLHAHATPAKWVDPLPDARSDLGSLS